MVVSIADATLASPQLTTIRWLYKDGLFQSQTRRLLPRNMAGECGVLRVSVVSIADATLASPQHGDDERERAL